MMERRSMPIARGWFQAAVLTYLIGFSVLGVLAYLVVRDQPPIPARVVAADGRTVFSREDVLGGMSVFARFGVMELGSIYGHGAYLGPDFTADYLHRSAELLIARYRNGVRAVSEARQGMIALNKQNGETGRAPLNFGMGVHVGDVMYGNIGSSARLDFTVIGPAVNMASRLEALTKQTGKNVLLSRAFADLVKDDFELERVGEFPVRGFSEPVELFAYQG